MSSKIADALPGRPMARNELYALEKKSAIRYALPQSSTFDESAKNIDCFAIIGDGETVAVGFDHDEGSWLKLHREPTPETAYAGPYVTNEDSDHPEIERVLTAMREWSEENSALK